MLEVYESLVNGQVQQARAQARAARFSLADFAFFLCDEQGLTAKETLKLVAPLYQEPRMPDPARHNPSPTYIQHILKEKNLSAAQAAKAIGMARSTFSSKMNRTSFTYAEQFTLEQL